MISVDMGVVVEYKYVTYATAGIQLERGFYSLVQLEKMVEGLRNLNTVLEDSMRLASFPRISENSDGN